MSDYRREPVEGAAPLTHTDAETLISARLDGPLDPVMNRALLAHLATCESCRAFASQMESMATAFRDLPVLPPSPTVARKVRAEIRGGGSPMRRFGRWVTTSKAAPATALAGAALALALVTASVFGAFDDGNGNSPTVNAPNFAAQSGPTSNSAAQALTETPAESAGETGAPTRPANVQVAPTQEPTSSDYSSADVAMKQTEPPTSEAQQAQQSETSSNPAQAAPTGQPEQGQPPADTARDTGSGGAASTSPSGASGAPPTSTEPLSGSEQTPTPGSQAAFSAASEQSPEATATEEPAATATEEPAPTETPEPAPTETPQPEATETAILSPTETPTPEPTETATPEPTETATPEPTETPTVAPTETATNAPEPTPTSTSTPEPTAIIGMAGGSTPEAEAVSPTVTPQPAHEEPTATETPGIVPRGGSTTQDETATSGNEQVTPAESQPTVSSNETGAAGANESQSGQIVPRSGTTNDQTEATTEPSSTGDQQASNGAQGGDTGEAAPAPAKPLAFGDLPDGSFAIPTSGSFIPSGTGLYAVEHSGGGMEIYDSNGVAVVSGYGYNPVWGNGGQTLYTAGGAISEGSSAVNAWSASGGPDFVTDGNAIDTPAGDIGGLAFIRFQPGGDPVLSLWTVGADAPIWQSNDYQLVSQTIYVAGGTVFVPTDQGWLAIPAGGGDASIIGGIGVNGVDEVILSPDGSQVAFISGGTVYAAPSTNPAAAAHVADVGNGGVAWTTMGLAVASGGQISIWTGNGMVTIVDSGGDLTSPIWTGNELIVADASQGGATKVITADQINTILSG